MRDLTGLQPEAVAVLEALESARNNATELDYVDQEAFRKTLESAARQVCHGKRDTTKRVR